MNKINKNFIQLVKSIRTTFLFVGGIMLLFAACSANGKTADAYGNFEALEIIVSSEASGRIISSELENGRSLKAGEQVAQVDTINLHLKFRQLLAAKNEISMNTRDVLSQINVLNEQKNSLLIEQKRIENLIADSAATIRQYDDVSGRIKVTDRQIDAVKVKNLAVLSKLETLHVQMDEIRYELEKCKIISPINGIVLQKYVEPHELVMKGKALFKIANLDQMELKAYIDGIQLGTVNIGQKVRVFVDQSKKDNREMEGTISWIAPSAEFTPKIIQTKDERVKLVYAIKVMVKNDGSLKIGMPGEVKFNP
jgi:HlyD family secretion protein